MAMAEDVDPAEVRRQQVEALLLAIMRGDVGAILRASPAVLQTQGQEGFKALYSIMRPFPSAHNVLAMLQAWHAALTRGGVSEDQITVLLNTPHWLTTQNDWYPLLSACRWNMFSVDVVQWLVDHGADVIVRNKQGFTPLLLLCGGDEPGPPRWCGSHTGAESTAVNWRVVHGEVVHSRRDAA